MHKVWLDESHNAKPLARGETSKQGQRESQAKKTLGASGGAKKNMDKKGKGKEKAPASANVLEIVDFQELSITSSESIKSSCYET